MGACSHNRGAEFIDGSSFDRFDIPNRAAQCQLMASTFPFARRGSRSPRQPTTLPLIQTARILALVVLLLFPARECVFAAAPEQDLWNVSTLSKTPAAAWGATADLVQEVYYEGEPWQGKPTRIFAYLGRPAGAHPTRNPAMVLVHGGGGKAFRDWATHWAKLGYVALAMDLAGHGPNGRLDDGGPDQSDATKFRNFTETESRAMWTYHAVAAVVRGHSLLRSLPEVDPDRIGITGISWGGYLTCIVAGIDPRFKVAVPVYGCGFLGENSYWKDKSLAAMTSDARALWLRWFDPSQYVGHVRIPILFVNGTTDFAYPMDSYQKTYRLVPERWRNVSVAVDRAHGHIWTFPEVDAFAGSVLRGKPPWTRISAPRLEEGRLSAKLDSTTEIQEAWLCYTADTGAWQARQWKKIPAQLKGQHVTGELPSTRPLVVFLAVQDAAGVHISSEHLELPAP
jgi:dienelactone hydrolase